jgi:hypothetical protein
MARRTVPLIIAIVIVVAVVAVLAVALIAPPGIQAIDLAPQEANFVAGVQISKILTDEDIIEAYNEAEKPPEFPQTFDEALDWVEDEIGLDPRDFSEALIFGDIESEDYFGGIVKGTFVEEELIASIEEATGEEMPTIAYNDYQIYIITEGAQELGICFLGNDTIAVGPVDAVKDVIDVKKGDKERLSGPVYDTYNKLGEAWIKGALEVPGETMGEIPEGGVPIGLAAFEDLEVMGFSFNKAGESLFIQVKLYFSDAESAADAEEMISSMMSLLPLMPDVPPEIVALLDELSVSLSDSWVTISLETTMTEIEELMEAMSTATETSYNADMESIHVSVLAYFTENSA